MVGAMELTWGQDSTRSFRIVALEQGMVRFKWNL